jgi:hypothetical protein
VSGRAGRARGAGAVATSMRSVERSVSTTAHSQSAIVTTSTSGPVVRSAAVHGPRWTGAVRGHSVTEQGALSSRGVSTSARVNGVRADVSGRGNRQVCHSHTRWSTSTAATAAAAGAGRIGAHCGPAMPGVRVGRQHGGHGYRHREFHSTSALLSGTLIDNDVVPIRVYYDLWWDGTVRCVCSFSQSPIASFSRAVPVSCPASTIQCWPCEQDVLRCHSIGGQESSVPSLPSLLSPPSLSLSLPPPLSVHGVVGVMRV